MMTTCPRSAPLSPSSRVNKPAVHEKSTSPQADKISSADDFDKAGFSAAPPPSPFLASGISWPASTTAPPKEIGSGRISKRSQLNDLLDALLRAAIPDATNGSHKRKRSYSLDFGSLPLGFKLKRVKVRSHRHPPPSVEERFSGLIWGGALDVDSPPGRAVNVDVSAETPSPESERRGRSLRRAIKVINTDRQHHRPSKPSSSPGSTPTPLRRVLTSFLPPELDKALQWMSLLYDPETQDLHISYPTYLNASAPLHASEFAWSADADGGGASRSRRISKLRFVLGEESEKKHYETVLWIVYWAWKIFRSGIQEISVVSPQELSRCQVSKEDLMTLRVPPAMLPTPQSSSVKSYTGCEPMFPNLKAFIWVGHLHFLSAFLPRAAVSKSLRMLYVKNERLAMRDAQYLLWYFSVVAGTEVDHVTLGSLREDAEVVLAPDEVGGSLDSKGLLHEFEHREPFSLPNLKIFKLDLGTVSKLDQLFHNIDLPRIWKVELTFTDGPHLADQLMYLKETKLVREGLAFLDLVFDQDVLETCSIKEVIEGIRKNMPSGAVVRVLEKERKRLWQRLD
ncbi:hypothetical protein CVT26_014731 [Gymnopilus dilepis]|uniref:Uncharacterized protein n=1 Tax=Gymnopilus dilepis TaxID=231916 RepID=A0A409W3J7_9AGAR|nr:hypothetical protein CVT26_014731 [Gymnopilus dilepis]